MARVRCKQHGIFHDPEGPECPLCRSASAKQGAGRGWREVGVGAGVTAVVVAVIFSTSLISTFASPPPPSHESMSGEPALEIQRGADAASADSAAPSHASETGATSAGALTDIRTELQMLTDLHAILASTIESARTRALHIPEPVRDQESPDAARQQREWDSVRQPVLTSLETVSGRIPSSYRWSRNGDLALRSMERAATGLAATLPRPTLPSRTSRESSFERATDQLERATTYLTRMAR